MRVLILPPFILSKPTSGVRRTVDVFSRFEKHQITVALDKNSLKDAEKQLMDSVHRFPKSVVSETRFLHGILRSTLRLIREATKNDLIFCYDEYPLSVFYSYFIAIMSRRPLVVFFHIIIPETARLMDRHIGNFRAWLYRRALDCSVAFICLDNGKEEGILKSYFPRKPVYFALNGVDPGSISLQPAQDRIFSDGVFVGVLEHRKGATFLPDIWKEVLAVVPEAKLFLVGKSVPEVENELHKVIESFGISERVVFKGFVDEKTKAAILAGAKVFLLPSKDEGISLALLEALASGIPAVVWDLPMYDRIEEGVLRAQFSNVKDFASKVIALLKDERSRLEVGSKGASWVREKMTWDEAAARDELTFDSIEDSLK